MYMDDLQNHRPLDTKQYIWSGIVVVSTSNRQWVHRRSGFDPRSRNVILGVQTWLSTLATVHNLVGRGGSMVGGMPLRNLGKFVYPRLPVSFRCDTNSCWSLLSGVYARGSKISHTGGKCVTCHGLHILEKGNSEINPPSHVSPRTGCLENTSKI